MQLYIGQEGYKILIGFSKKKTRYKGEETRKMIKGLPYFGKETNNIIWRGLI